MELCEAKNLSVAPYHVPIKSCSKPKSGLVRKAQEFKVDTKGVVQSYELTILCWIIASALSREKDNGEHSRIPGCAGIKLVHYRCCQKSHTSDLQSDCFYKGLVFDEEHPTLITFNMAVYEKAVQLLDSRHDLKRTVLPRLGELHAVMAALRAIGTCIEKSEIDDALIESDIYGSTTT